MILETSGNKTPFIESERIMDDERPWLLVIIKDEQEDEANKCINRMRKKRPKENSYCNRRFFSSRSQTIFFEWKKVCEISYFERNHRDRLKRDCSGADHKMRI
jgi:hypothetical protein